MMTGVSVPSVEQILKICDFLDISLYNLLGIENPYNLSYEEIKIIKAFRENGQNKELIKRVLNIK